MISIKTFLVAIPALLFLVPLNTLSAESPLSHRLGAPEGGVELGFGWDLIEGQTIPNRCVRFAPVRETGQTSTVTMTEVSDQSEIMDQLDVSATASIKSIGGSASAQASFAKNSKTSATETTLLLKATVQNGVLFAGPEDPGCPARRAFPQIPENSPKSQYATSDSSGCQSEGEGEDLVDNIKFSPFAQKLKDTNLDEFHKMCGDAYVSRIYSGAELLATIGISTTGTEDQTSTVASVKAGFGGGQVGAETKTDKGVKRESANLSIHFAQVGGGGGLMPISREGLSGKLQSLTIEAARDPTFIGIEVTSYRSLANGPKERSLRDLRDREISADTYWFLLSLEQEISDILATPQAYDFTVGLTPHSLRELQDNSIKIRENIRKLEYVTSPVDLSPDTPSPVGLECNDHTIDWVEPKTLPTLEELRKIADKKKNNDSPLTATDLRENLRTVLPYCNPNVLRLYLPPPTGQLAVDTYIRPLAQRMCALDPSDNECLTNAQISALDRGLKTFTARTFLLQNVASGRCLGGSYKEDSPICTDTNKAQQFDLFWDPKWERHTKLPPGTLGEYALIKRPTGKDLHCLSRSKASNTIKYEVQKDNYWDTEHCGWHILSDGRINSARKEYSKEGDQKLACLGMNQDKDDLWKMEPKSCEPRIEERDQIRWRMIPVPTK